ncbi:MAG TPA: alpha-glucosidase [Candidatus Atribacteria bacterium]|nr:alpha-glucosidase [Candidatus Atribacteria bacterium]HPT79103.1 alpha-glucosidase [Candidatus Atribacteria bacterium]
MSKWWQERVVYQIYPRSFQDTNGDGIGDIPGIISRLDLLKDLGIGIIWLSPVYPSPNADYGYDISDYKGIHPDFGTMADMEKLIAEAEKRDIKIIMDLVINHTSDEHPWFQASRDKASPYRDYYIWRPGRESPGPGRQGKPPNNWTSFFGEGAWEYDEKSGEYYLHLFAKKQPDLNWHNPKVFEEVKDIMRFWLDKGIAGFRCDVINILYKTSLKDGRKKLALTGSEYYLSQEGTHEILRRLRREVLDSYDCFTVGETVFVTTETAKDLCGQDRGELDMIFSFEHMETDQYFVKWFKRKFHAGRFARTITKWQQAIDWNANYLENHDQPRCVSRFGDDEKFWDKSAKLLCILLLTLKGTPFIYQGQEIGMTNFDFTSMDEIRDVESHNIYRLAEKLHFPARVRWNMIRATSRDNARTPMQWDAGPGAGFTAGEPWLGINKNHEVINMAAQLDDPASIRSLYKAMIRIRNMSDILKYGSFEPLKITRRLFAYKRVLDGKALTILLNFSSSCVNTGFTGEALLSNYADKFDTDALDRPGTAFAGRLRPWEAVILKAGDAR